MARSYTEYLQWIKTEFAPLVLATPDDTIKQFVENAIRYWNTHSAYKISAMIPYTVGQIRAELPAQFKCVADVIPNRKTTWIWNDHPLWTLTSIQILDSVTTDLIMMSEAFRNYRIYVGADFRWWHYRSDLLTSGGYLYCINVPGGTTSLFVIGTKRILPDEDITELHIKDWILRYTKALVKQAEGNTLRKAATVHLTTDGQQLVDEGMKEMEDLQKDLERSSRWVVFIKRV